LERKWARIGEGLKREGVHPPQSRTLDIGVYVGSDSPHFMRAGFQPDKLVALDLDQRSAGVARVKHRWLRAVVGNGTILPFRDRSFDVVYQSMMISSVLDPGRRLTILREADRVLRSGGSFISYDTRYPNPWNRQTRPLKLAEMRKAFPGWTLNRSTLTGIPQIIRPLSRISLSLCRMVEAVPILRSHLLVFARKP
jgi:ubiquinone/menaquinone biosynthesis C-methylase UbiE